MFDPCSNTSHRCGPQPHVMLIRSVEAVQRRFTKRLLGMDQLQYTERLTHLGLQSLEQRRLITDLTSYYNIIPRSFITQFLRFFLIHSQSIVPRSLSSYFNPTSQIKYSKTFFLESCYKLLELTSQLPSSQPQVHHPLNVHCSLSTCNLTYPNHG